MITNILKTCGIAMIGAVAGSLGTAALQAQGATPSPGFVGTVIQPYLGIHRGLAADDLAAAKTGAADLVKAMAASPGEGTEPSKLGVPAKAIATAADLAAARTAFADLSRALSDQICGAGATPDHPLYLARCPMALGGAGAVWFQSDKEVANPYFGAAMLRCGEIEEVGGESALPR